MTGQGREPNAGAGRDQIRAGMRVVGADGGEIGQVKEVREDDLWVTRPGARDLYVPYMALHRVEADRVVLNVPADRVEEPSSAVPERGESEGPAG